MRHRLTPTGLLFVYQLALASLELAGQSMGVMRIHHFLKVNMQMVVMDYTSTMDNQVMRPEVKAHFMTALPFLEEMHLQVLGGMPFM